MIRQVASGLSRLTDPRDRDQPGSFLVLYQDKISFSGCSSELLECFRLGFSPSFPIDPMRDIPLGEEMSPEVLTVLELIVGVGVEARGRAGSPRSGPVGVELDSLSWGRRHCG
jgi:hypothetical protein